MGHTANKWQSWGLKPGSVSLESSSPLSFSALSSTPIFPFPTADAFPKQLPMRTFWGCPSLRRLVAVLTGSFPWATVLGSLACSADDTSKLSQEAAFRPNPPLPACVPLGRSLALSGPILPFFPSGGFMQEPLLLSQARLL